MKEIVDALLAGDWPEQPPWVIRSAASSIAERTKRGREQPTATEIRKACQVLKSNNEFDSVVAITERWRAHRRFDPWISRLAVQSHIEINELDLAENIACEALETIEAQGVVEDNSGQKSELEGLRARIFKQRYVTSGDPEDFRQALARYWHQYELPGTDTCWHGVNMVALLSIAERDHRLQPLLAEYPDAASIAMHVKEVALPVASDLANDNREWAVASLAEMAMSLGADEEAELWLHRLLSLPKRSPFVVQSFQRQLREIWYANAYADSPSCADTLARIIAENQDRRFDKRSFSPVELHTLIESESALEKNFSGNGFFSVASIQRMLQSCRSIGCVTNAKGVRLGSGFLIRGESLHPEWGAGLLFVTNAHVVSDEVPEAMRIVDARVTFDLQNELADAPVFYRVDELMFSSKPGLHGVVCDLATDLDVTIVRLKGVPENAEGLDVADDLPIVTDNARVYVIGHPRGSEIQISLHDSRLLDIDTTRRLIHYRTPTDPGSSGSPVFNAVWQLIALHHAGSSRMPKFIPDPPPPFYEANEGISITAIKSALASQLKAK